MEKRGLQSNERDGGWVETVFMTSLAISKIMTKIEVGLRQSIRDQPCDLQDNDQDGGWVEENNLCPALVSLCRTCHYRDSTLSAWRMLLLSEVDVFGVRTYTYGTQFANARWVMSELEHIFLEFIGNLLRSLNGNVANSLRTSL